MQQRLAPASVGYPLQMTHCCQLKSLGMSKPSKNMTHAIANALLKKLKKWQKKERRYTKSLLSGDWTFSTAFVLLLHTNCSRHLSTHPSHIYSPATAAMQFKENEEKWEKKVEETMGQQATASDAKAAKVDKSLNKNALSSSTSADDVLQDDIPEGEQARTGS